MLSPIGHSELHKDARWLRLKGKPHLHGVLVRPDIHANLLTDDSSGAPGACFDTRASAIDLFERLELSLDVLCVHRPHGTVQEDAQLPGEEKRERVGACAASHTCTFHSEVWTPM